MKTKCQIIPASIYDNIPPVVFEDDKWRYILGNSGHLIRLRKKTCSICPISMSHVVIFEYAKHNRVERFCSQHASEFGELPPIPEIPLSEITDKQRRKIPQISTEAIDSGTSKLKSNKKSKNI